MDEQKTEVLYRRTRANKFEYGTITETYKMLGRKSVFVLGVLTRTRTCTKPLAPFRLEAAVEFFQLLPLSLKEYNIPN
jgi:hypothetical protein